MDAAESAGGEREVVLGVSVAGAAQLGRLERLDPRTVWTHEARDFTPWLYENRDYLEEALGIDIEFDEMEHSVGGYKLDLKGRDLTNDAVLIVENQLEGTDHGHLGQLLTYAAGTGAATIVWIARTFREEHRQALSWLNEESGEKTHFFGVQLALGRIGNSACAPLLDVVVQPNEWQKQMRNRPAIGPRGELYAEFWPRLIERIRADHPSWTSQTPETAAKPYNAVAMRAPIREARLYCSFAQNHHIRHELYIDAGTEEDTEAAYARLEGQRKLLEDEYGRSLEFDPIEGKRACRIADYLDGDINQTERHGEFVDWFVDTGERWRRALAAVEGD